MPWIRAKLHGEAVLARARDDGSLLVERGQVEVRYRQRSGRLYKARVSNLACDAPTELLPDDSCADAVLATHTRAASRRRLKGAALAEAAWTVAPPGSQVTNPTGPPAARAAETAGADAGPTTAAAQDPSTRAPIEPVVAYADGACSGNPGPAGIGIVLRDGSTQIELGACLGVATNNIAELTAIERALALVPDRRRNLVIYTDSIYSIGVLCKGWKVSANVELVSRLRTELRRRPTARLVHVPGHAGVELNERADCLAREAVRTGTGWTTQRALPAESLDRVVGAADRAVGAAGASGGAK